MAAIESIKEKPMNLAAGHFIEHIEKYRSPVEAMKQMRYFKTGEGQYGEGDVFMGVRMGQIFEMAKAYIHMPLEEIELLLQSPIHEIRTGALSIVDKQSRSKKITLDQRKLLYELYLRNTHRINNWDLVDICAPRVVGGYLYVSGEPRDVLYNLAVSENIWERRTAIVATGYFIRKGDIEDTFRIAELLLNDREDLIHKATGWMLRSAGQVNRPQLQKFLDKYAATMPRTLLRYSIEHFDKPLRSHYMGLKRAG
ncbi:3-methyladenine DNA glycosylase AlkD [Dyadobacter sp. BE34]|uniref:3-methyladenine DNA glycosylase AlkD n=1 Tax=Dyadobacter fermentans TaxID=94254 RepID=A0ABU1QTG7_9BACT|nr:MULTISPECIES: DNA alkylation repair protein [Dyadobacter]MDR6804434.1 3-methyladenine DNA glycosylase AlkD [Dyadobacter fermentans]MDR7042174.1 3-methyladenine DNA glycosylase AlkD [Dyadobacter sp. BE242]MDR7196576.1 3-methyladenine DNA glycosylase AlkD [Dyadobacter sp. BE34]MDR7212878.1 3-methyladenine DNA glycosylase AlkD [Dyadobacter sp. BE31]MDR7261983.1 3-methyladenine DNA glycosylase AlkD [Dyadobacter sp. BE32]